MNFPGKLPSILLLVLLAVQGKHASVRSAQWTAQRLCSRLPAGLELLKLLTFKYSTVESTVWMRDHLQQRVVGIKPSLGRSLLTGRVTNWQFVQRLI